MLEAALAAIDRAHGADPTVVRDGERELPAELLYAERMSARLAAFRPDAPAALVLACRAQHLERWTRPRAAYPDGRAGYLAWRRDAGRAHAERAIELVRGAGLDEATAQRVAALVRKARVHADPDAQTLEDVACLVFLEHYAEAFFAGRDARSIADIVSKTAAKMSEAGRSAVASLALAPPVERALAVLREA